MPVYQIDQLDDPRLDVYRDIRRTNVTRWSDHFIAEGPLVVERLIASRFETLSLLVSSARAAAFLPQLQGDPTVYVVPHELCCELVGFDFHRGIMACGRRAAWRPESLHPTDRPSRSLLVACPHTSLPDNLGSIIRIAASFSATGLLVGPQSADPFSRRVIRVSMGNVFQLPLLEPIDLADEIRQWKMERGYQVLAATRGDKAIGLRKFQPSNRLILMLGNEAHGLGDEWLALADQQITIEMSDNVDSLNVANAAAILMYELTQHGL